MVTCLHATSAPEVSSEPSSSSKEHVVLALKGGSTIAAGYNHTLALKNDGTVYATGNNQYGESNVDSWKNMVAVAAGWMTSFGIKDDGTILAIGKDIEQFDLSGWTDIVELQSSKSGLFVVGLKKDGHVVTSLSSGIDPNEDQTSTWTDIAAISAGNYHIAGLKKDGTVLLTVFKNAVSYDLSDWNPCTAISCGQMSIWGLQSDGTVIAAGADDFGENIFENNGLSGISAGYTNVIGIRKDGSVLASGMDNKGQCKTGEWEDIVCVAQGLFHSVGLKRDGTLVATGTNLSGQCDISDWRDIRMPRN